GANAAWAAERTNGVLVQNAGGYSPSPALGLAARARITASQDVANTDLTCPAQPAGNVRVVQLSTSAPVSGSRGALVAVYALTRYDVATEGGRLWLRRNSGMDASDAFLPQPLAGPLAADRFDLQYRNAAGAVIAPGALAASLANIREVRVRVVTESTQRMNGTMQRDSGEAVVSLRNPT
ncbi:MAG TPA: hypothetical protein VK358_00900, partial [Longimicrobium sp.]|nr:hypothetical protein [Longimicrobium sp.]